MLKCTCTLQQWKESKQKEKIRKEEGKKSNNEEIGKNNTIVKKNYINRKKKKICHPISQSLDRCFIILWNDNLSSKKVLWFQCITHTALFVYGWLYLYLELSSLETKTPHGQGLPHV